MNESNQEISGSIIDSIKQSDISKLTPDLLEIGLDEILEDGIIKEIPVVKTIQAFYKTVITISDKILIKKIVLFLNRLNDVSKEIIDDFVTKLDKEPKFKKEIGEKLLLILEKSDDYEKSLMWPRAAFIPRQAYAISLNDLIFPSCEMA